MTNINPQIELGKYGLDSNDFWPMDGKMIVTFDGCKKINMALPPDKRIRTECISVDKDGWGGALIYVYNCPQQGVYAVGEVNSRNYKGDYPYPIAYKRMYVRAVLSLSALASIGVYGEDESEDFRRDSQEESRGAYEYPSGIPSGNPSGMNPVYMSSANPAGGFSGYASEPSPAAFSAPPVSAPMQTVPFPGSMPYSPAMPQTVSAGFKEPMQSPAASAPPVTAHPNRMTLEEAKATVCPTGGYAGQTLGMLPAEALKYLADSRLADRYPQVRDAARTILAAG